MKYWSTRIIILVLLIGVFLSGYNYFHRPFLNRFGNQETQLTPEEVPATSPVQIALEALSAEEKILQLISYPVVVSVPEASLAAEIAWVQEHQPGFVTLFGSNVSSESAATVTQEILVSPRSYSPLIAVDHEGGTVQRLRGEGFSVLPSWRQQCQMTEEERQVLLSASAAELAEAGVHIVFAPVLDVARSGSFLGTRACLTSEETVTAAEDFITEFAGRGILPVVKHYPGIGSSTRDLHFQSDTIELQPEDTEPFTLILSAFPNIGVMTSHAIIQERTDGQPCSLNETCLSPFTEYFPQVLLFSDALEMVAAGAHEGSSEPRSLTERAEQALRAGNHVLVFGEMVTPRAIEEIVSSLAALSEADGQFSAQIDAAVSRVLMLKMPIEGTEYATE